MVAYLSRGQATFSGESGLLEEQQRRPPQAQISFDAEAQTVDNIIYDCQENMRCEDNALVLSVLGILFTIRFVGGTAHDSTY